MTTTPIRCVPREPKGVVEAVPVTPDNHDEVSAWVASKGHGWHAHAKNWGRPGLGVSPDGSGDRTVSVEDGRWLVWTGDHFYDCDSAHLDAEFLPGEPVLPCTTVVNKHHKVPYDVYIGRGSIWGNPYVIGKDGDRDEVIDKYEAHLLGSPHLLDRLAELQGKRLACFCAPKRCHGDVLARYADKQVRERPVTHVPLPDVSSDTEVRDWMLRLRESGDATGAAMSIRHAIGELTQLYRLALWAALANGEDEDVLAASLETGIARIYDDALTDDTRQTLDMLELDDPNCSPDTGQRWNPEV